MNTEDDIKANIRAIRSFLNKYPKEMLENSNEEFLLEYSIKVSKSLEWTANELKRLVQEKEKLLEQCEELEKAKRPINKYADYPRSKDFIAKLQFILSKNNDPMSFEEITAVFFSLEPDLSFLWRNPRKSISKVISRACKFGTVSRKKIFGSHGAFVYA